MSSKLKSRINKNYPTQFNKSDKTSLCLLNRIEQLESEKKTLIETIQFKLKENEILKQNETQLLTKINDLNNKILINSTQMIEENFLNKINSLELKLKNYEKSDQNLLSSDAHRIENKYDNSKITVKLKPNKKLDKNIWNCLPKGTVNRENIKNEFEIIKNLSEHLIVDNFNRNPTFHRIRKTINGYSIDRHCYTKGKSACYWIININLNKNEATLSCSKNCLHYNPKKIKSFSFFLEYTTIQWKTYEL